MTKSGRVIRASWITRDMVRANPDTLYVFGDNMERRGYGGQAKEMRGEPNAIGVPTKWAPGRRARDYFSNDDLLNRDVYHAICEAFDKIHVALDAGRDVVIPTDGLGTGLAELPIRVPLLHRMIERAIAALEKPEDAA